MTPEQLARSGTEDAHQMALFQWAAMNRQQHPCLEWLHAIPNGGQRNARTGAKMKATGTRSGVWDVFLPFPRSHYHGLYIEMKKPGLQNHKNGGLSDKQVEFGQFAQQCGYWVAVCYSWEEAVQVIEGYLTC